MAGPRHDWPAVTLSKGLRGVNVLVDLAHLRLPLYRTALLGEGLPICFDVILHDILLAATGLDQTSCTIVAT